MQEDKITPHSLRFAVQRQILLGIALFSITAFLVYLLCTVVAMAPLFVHIEPLSVLGSVGVFIPIPHLVIDGALFFFAGRFIVRRAGKIKFALLGGFLISCIYGICAYAVNKWIIMEYNTYKNCGTFFPSPVSLVHLWDTLFFLSQ